MRSRCPMATVAAVAAVLCRPAMAAPSVALEENTPGHVLAPHARAVVHVRLEGDGARWSLRDFWDREAARGEATASQGAADIVVPTDRPGYFRLVVTSLRGGAAVGTATMPLAVVPAADPRRIRDNPFGVMTHFAQGWDTDILPLLARAGIGALRDEHYWRSVEKKPDQYAFPPQSDRYMAAAARLGIAPLIVMSFENPLYDGGRTPFTPEGCDAYGRYGKAILGRYGRQIGALEVWNEYNGSWCDGTAATDRPRYYAQMLRRTWEQVKAVRPDVKVAGCACVLIPLPYLEGIFRQGGLRYMDAVVIHPYRGQPEGVDQEVAELRALIRRYNGAKDKPVWSTESGLVDRSEYAWEAGLGTFEKGRANVARYLVRQNALLLASGVERSWWYLARDYAEFKTMGLLRDPADPAGRYAVAPAYVAYATLIRRLAGARTVRREPTARWTRAYLFRRGRQDVRVCWATHPTTLRLRTLSPLVVTDIMGASREVKPAGGWVSIPLTEDPVYVEGKVGAVAEEPAADPILADSREDYAKQQGASGWSYGWSVDGRAFQAMKPVQTVWGYDWGGDAPYLALKRDGAHPSAAEGHPVWAVRRWTCPAAGRLRVTGSFSHDRQGDGTGGRVLLDGREVFSALVGGPVHPTDAPFDLRLDVKTGSAIDFVVTPGPGTDTSYDYTTFEATIRRLKL